jgi:hypothetical protein
MTSTSCRGSGGGGTLHLGEIHELKVKDKNKPEQGKY